MTTPKPAPRKSAVIELDKEDFNGDVIIHKNLTQDVLVITEDKMKLTLLEYKNILSASAEWFSASTTVLSFLAALLLTNFKDVGPLTAETWQAIYFMFFVISLARFINVLYKMYRNRKKANVDYVIRKLKQSNDDNE
jgi:hypothetical protein